MKAAHWVVTVFILLLGAVHTGIGFYCKHLSENTLWFIGSGIAILFAGLFNLLVIIVGTKPVRLITFVVNIVTAGLFVYAAQVMQETQVYVGIAIFILATILTIIKGKSISR